MSDLPRGWVTVRLSDVAEVRLGRQRSPKNHSGTHMRPYLRAANVDWDGLKLDDVKEMNFSDAELAVYRLEPGDLLLNEASGSPDEVGKPALWNGSIEDCCFQNTLIRVRSKGPDVRFLLHFFGWQALSGAFASASRGVGIHHIGSGTLADWPMPLPPLAEQRRIVDALEDHLSRLDAAQSQLAGALRRCRALRDAAVAELVQGRDGWERHAIGSLLREPLRNGHSAPASADGCGVRTLTITAVTVDDFSDANTKVTSADPVRVRDLWLEPGDILVQRSNTPELVGTTAMYDGPRDWAIFPDLLIRLRPCDRLLPEFLTAVLRSGPVRRHFRDKAKGLAGSMPKIDQPTIMSTVIPVPSIPEQRRVLEAYRLWNEEIGRLRAALEAADRRAVHLRASLLRQAFSGRLVPQDPSDEPASALLDRIRSEPSEQPYRSPCATGMPTG